MNVSKKIVIHFAKRLVDRPIIYRLVKDFNLEFNILKASISPKKEGLLVLELSGKQKEYDKAVKYLTKTTPLFHQTMSAPELFPALPSGLSEI